MTRPRLLRERLQVFIQPLLICLLVLNSVWFFHNLTRERLATAVLSRLKSFPRGEVTVESSDEVATTSSKYMASRSVVSFVRMPYSINTLCNVINTNVATLLRHYMVTIPSLLKVPFVMLNWPRFFILDGL